MLYAKQMKASFIRNDVKKYIENYFFEEDKQNVYNLFDYNSYFDVVSNFVIEKSVNGVPEFAKNLTKVAQNIVQRGFPTRAPKILEAINYDSMDLDESGIKKSLIIYDENFHYTASYAYMEKTADGIVKKAQINNTEVALLSSVDSHVAQFIEIQKPLEDLISYPNTDIKKYEDYARYALNYSKKIIENKFSGQRLDFTLQLPNEHCLNIEFDGPTHNDTDQKYLDRQRDKLLESLNWEATLRVNDINDEEIPKRINQIFMSAFGEVEWDKDSLQCITMPLFAARMAKLFLYLVEQGFLKLFSKTPVYICVETDNDVETYNSILYYCLELLGNLLRLSKKDKSNIADICIRYKINDKIMDYTISLDNAISQTAHKNFKSKSYVVIKDQMHRRLCYMDTTGYSEEKNQKVIWLLSSYSQWSDYSLRISDKHIRYNVTEKDKAVVEYFLNDMFGKEHFRPKQFEIVQIALNGKNVIGLLPTGSGKSIAFQLSALLQPMPSIIIAPLVSLMEDQVYNLISNGITNVASINSSRSIDEKQECLKGIIKDNYSFVYISPERLQIPSFRETIGNKKIGYVVLDEAHCVSQWGHDFRTSYLRVGDTVKRFAPDAVIMALTGTASSNVITDIKRELHMSKKVSIVAIENFRREELHFRVLKKKSNSSLADTIKDGIINIAVDEAVRELSKAYDKSFREYMLPTEKGYENAGIVFNPYAAKNRSSVADVFAKLKQLKTLKNLEIGQYTGQLNTAKKTSAQRDFIENQTAVLVSTKAFGMGIDKPNIRFTVHTCVPESIEAFYQEAGRAGRDGNYAVNIIVAPPDSTKYDESEDKKIYSYFINQSFPAIDKVKEAMRNLISKSTFYVKNHSFALLEDIVIDGCLPANVQLIVDKKNRQENAELILGKSDGLKFNISIDSETKNVSFYYLNKMAYEKEISNNVLLEYYVEHMVSKLSRKISEAEFKGEEELKNYINTCTSEYRASIVDCVRKSFDHQPVECFIRLDMTIVNNPIERLIEELFSSANPTLKEIVIPESVRSIIESIKDNIEKIKKNTNMDIQIKNSKIRQYFNAFKTHYFTILKENGLPDELKKLFDDVYNTIGHDQVELTQYEGDVNIDKLLYYLGILGIYSNYERDYSKNFIKIYIEPVTKESLKKNIKDYLKGYETADYVEKVIKKLNIFDNLSDDDTEALIIAASDYIIEYSYNKIREYRVRQTENMYKCTEDSAKLVDNVYQYFEAKYYTDLYNDVINENISTALKWIKKLEGSEYPDHDTRLNLNDLSHLRSSAMKCRAARPQAYTPYLLMAYCILRDTNLSIKDGLDQYLKGLEKLNILRTNYHKEVRELAEWCLNTNDKRFIEEVSSFIEKDFTANEQRSLNAFRNIINRKLNDEQNLFMTEL